MKARYGKCDGCCSTDMQVNCHFTCEGCMWSIQLCGWCVDSKRIYSVFQSGARYCKSCEERRNRVKPGLTKHDCVPIGGLRF